MPRRKRVPGYLLHKSTGHARVIVNGRQVFLGKYNSPESIEKYQRIIAELKAGPVESATVADVRGELTVAELLAKGQNGRTADGRTTSGSFLAIRENLNFACLTKKPKRSQTSFSSDVVFVLNRQPASSARAGRRG